MSAADAACGRLWKKFALDLGIDRLSGKFTSPQTEAAFQRFIVEGDCANNFRVLIFALPLFPLYGIFDYFNLDNPGGAIALRVIVSIICTILLFSFRTEAFEKHHQWLTFTIVFLLGLAINSVSYFFGDLSYSYHVALVQGYVFVCFLLRISLYKTLLVMASFMAVFVPAAYSMPDPSEANVQSFVMLTMFVVCGIGAYIVQRFRRFDFQKVLIIEEQNQQLSRLLAAAEQGNERKVAALNLLVHLIKTPLHQISGFSDILVSGVAESGDEAAENAKYIKSATRSLTKSVNGLLAYHRLDQSDAIITPKPFNIVEALNDFAERLPEGLSPAVKKSEPAIAHADPEMVGTAFETLAEYYSQDHSSVSQLSCRVSHEDGDIIVSLRDDGQVLSSAQFKELTLPLTQIDDYLGHAGGQIAMGLRTVARAIDLAGGKFTHEPAANGNHYFIRLPASASKALAA